MSLNKIQICNLAISWVGGESIISLEDPTTEASLCKTNYDACRMFVLEEREWTFAQKRTTLIPLVDIPEFGFSYKFLIPPDSLTTNGVYDPRNADRNNTPQIDHNIEGGYILANLAEINLRYTFNQENTNKFSPLFSQAVASHIARNIAMPLTKDKNLQREMAAFYADNLERAISSNSLQGTREKLNTSQMEKSRRFFVRPE